MRRTVARIYLCVQLILCILVLTSCGGGSSSTLPPPPPPPPPPTSQIVVVDGDQQFTYAGGSPLKPLHVLVTSSGVAVSSAQVTFTSSSGVQIFPSQTSTGPSGHARALVHLPDVPFSKFTISASVSGGNTVTFTEFTGPRLLQVFGNGSGNNGAVAPDGTYYGQGSGLQPISGPGGTVVAPDGTVKAYLGSVQKKINLPDPGSIGEGGSGFIATAVSPDGKIYFFDPELVDMIVLDSQLNIVNFLDLGARNPSAGLFDFDSFFAIAPNGNIYWNTGQSAVTIYDPTGTKIGEVVTQPNSVTLVFGLVATQTNNFLLLLPNSTSGSLLNEFNVQTGLVHSLTIPLGVGLARDSKGNYAVLECCNPLTVAWYDEQYNLLRQTALNSQIGNYFGGFYVDDSGNTYLGGGTDSILKFDASGNLAWLTAASLGDFSSPIHVNAVGLTAGMAVDPVSGTVFVQLSDFSAVNTFSQGLFQQQFQANGKALALSPGRELYSVGRSLPTTLGVYDLSGNLLRSLTFPQIQMPSGIGIAPDGTKFVLDVGLRSIHQIDSSDSYVGSFTLNLPSDVSLVSGNVVVAPDGNLILGVSDTIPNGSSSSDTYIKKISKTGAEIWSVAVPVLPNANFQNLAVDTSGRVYVLRSTRLEIWDTNGNTLSRVDLAPSTVANHAGMTSVGDQIYFCFAGRIYVVSPN